MISVRKGCKENCEVIVIRRSSMIMDEKKESWVNLKNECPAFEVNDD
jgi:hypothetical protein